MAFSPDEVSIIQFQMRLLCQANGVVTSHAILDSVKDALTVNAGIEWKSFAPQLSLVVRSNSAFADFSSKHGKSGGYFLKGNANAPAIKPTVVQAPKPAFKNVVVSTDASTASAEVAPVEVKIRESITEEMRNTVVRRKAKEERLAVEGFNPFLADIKQDIYIRDQLYQVKLGITRCRGLIWQVLSGKESPDGQVKFDGKTIELDYDLLEKFIMYFFAGAMVTVCDKVPIDERNLKPIEYPNQVSERLMQGMSEEEKSELRNWAGKDIDR